jgi:voltage-gated potassium channel
MYIKELNHILSVIRSKAHQLITSVFLIFLLMLTSSVLMYMAETKAQPDVFPNALSGLWWAVITLTTVGYGDIYPVTPLGQLIASFFALLSIALISIPTGIISAGFIARDEPKQKMESEPQNYCPNCGHKLRVTRAGDCDRQ